MLLCYGQRKLRQIIKNGVQIFSKILGTESEGGRIAKKNLQSKQFLAKKILRLAWLPQPMLGCN